MSARQFKYTINNKALTDAQREFYEVNGYILIKNNVPSSLIDELRQHFVDVCEKRKESPGRIVKDRSLKKKGYKGETVVNKIQDFLHDDKFFEYATFGPVTDVVESIIGPDIVGVHSMLINKPPDSHPDLSLHPLHQDLHYFPFRPVDSIVASWTAMELVNKENGCLYVVPGSHRRGELYPHTYPKGLRNALYHGISGLEDEQKLHVVMEKGDTIFFHPLLLHGSGPNFTKGYRKAISVHFANSSCYFIDVVGTTQEQISKEIEAIATVDYVTAWKLKSRNIRGDPKSFTTLPSQL
ncbi:hypothetical protein HHI36_017285 [Cryptolaemus montrouzieri]|uniref:phytanoyl-CoA dioxygenase n=1 Tax=Cryptolaemus montrouzieri TaxID=559131 RepID=A0ABD2NMT4_9CUCU